MVDDEEGQRMVQRVSEGSEFKMRITMKRCEKNSIIAIVIVLAFWCGCTRTIFEEKDVDVSCKEIHVELSFDNCMILEGQKLGSTPPCMARCSYGCTSKGMLTFGDLWSELVPQDEGPSSRYDLCFMWGGRRIAVTLGDDCDYPGCQIAPCYSTVVICESGQIKASLSYELDDIPVIMRRHDPYMHYFVRVERDVALIHLALLLNQLRCHTIGEPFFWLKPLDRPFRVDGNPPPNEEYGG